MGKPLVTVFIPMYNCEGYIGQALESILNQTYANLEILLIDDGSTDQTVEIVTKYNDNRIKLIQNKENKGIPYTRNLGVEQANGKYMAIMDSDDIALSNRIERQVYFMERNQDIDAIGTYYQMIGGRLKRVKKSNITSPEEIKVSLLFFSPISNPSSMIRLRTIKKHNLKYNLNYFVAQDYGMWLQISKVGKLAILPEVLLQYRTGHTNITKRTKTKKASRRKQILDSIHRDALSFYNFKLSSQELSDFNEFFNDNPQAALSNQTMYQIPNILKKLTDQCHNDFDVKLFSKITQKNFTFALSNHRLSLLKKIRLYKKTVGIRYFTFSLKELTFLMSKHIYRSVKKF
ncbi:Glycosyl transferase family 2 [Salinibacillus kushneri]|uniref:Glycosyl transferase family 2 n=1 Tax=Salinibacillus kushneri TaxID=237682 RepID=A0A1I0D0E6_9BACI|nr:glycosyltransferase family A protein [Salinibacillus kushneri]SET25538.1 Glycosyl transferase family 2 [Salinibacillus kushneri]